MAQTFRPFCCDVSRYSPGIPTTEEVSIPIVTFAVFIDGEPLMINGEISTVDPAWIAREYAGIPADYQDEV